MKLLGSQLETFLSVARLKTVQQSSRLLGVSQTAVTQRLQSLESQLETTLFIRSRLGMKLTPEGEALLRFCQAVQELEGEALARIQRNGTAGQVNVRISGPSSIMRSRVLRSLLSIRNKYRGIFLDLDLDDDDGAVEKLRSGKSQIALLKRSQVALEMDSRLLRKENYLFVVSKTWADRDLVDIVRNETVVDFAPSDDMTHQYLKKYRLFDLAQKERMFVNNTDALTEMVALGYGYSVLTEEFIALPAWKHRLKVINPHHSIENSLALAWYPRPEMPKYFEAILKAIN